MEHRQLGRTGVSVSKFCLGAMMFGAWGNPDHDESIADHPRGAGRRDQLHRHRRRLRAGRVGGDRRQGARGRPARRRDPRHQVPQRDGRGPQPAGQLAPLDHPRGGGFAAAAGHRLDRPLPGPPPRSAHRHRGDAVGAQRPRAPGQGPLHRLAPRSRPARSSRRSGSRATGGCSGSSPSSRRTRSSSVPSRPTSCPRARATAWPSCPTARWPAAGCRGAGARTPGSSPPRAPAGCPSASISRSRPTSASSTPSSSSPSSPTRRGSRSSSSRSRSCSTIPRSPRR